MHLTTMNIAMNMRAISWHHVIYISHVYPAKVTGQGIEYFRMHTLVSPNKTERKEKQQQNNLCYAN